MGYRRILILSLLVCGGGLTPLVSEARAEEWSLEYQLKAVVLYNFAKFVEWPSNELDGAQIPIVIGILGADPFGPEFGQAVRDKLAQGRHVVVRRYQTPADARNCQILFISSEDASSLPEILVALKGRGVLTVGEASDFLQLGGIVRLFLEQGKVRFEINPNKARGAGLKISSQLLSLAHIYRD